MITQEDDLPPVPAERGADPSRRFAWIVAAAVVVAVGIVVGAKPAYRQLRAWRGLRANAQLAALLDEGRWNEDAVGLLRIANKLAPNEAPVWRSTARYYSHFKNPQGLHYWQLYVSSGKAELSDRLDYIRLAQTLNRLDLSRQELLDVEKIAADNKEADILEVGQLLLEEKPAAAVYLSQRLLERYPNDPGALSVCGRIFSRSSDVLLRLKGQMILRDLLKGGQTSRADEALALAVSEGALSSDKRMAVEAVRKLSDPSASETLAAASLELSLDPERKDEICLEQVRRIADRPLAEQIVVAGWLLRQSRPLMTLDLLPLDKTRENVTGLQVRANALAMLDRWSDFEKLTMESHLPWQQWQRSCNSVVLAWHQKRDDQMAFHLDYALKEIDGNFTSAMEVAKVAELVGRPAIAARALEKVLAFPPFAHEAASDILRLVAPLNDAELSLEALRTLNRLHPDDALVKHEFIYTRLLKGEGPTEEEVSFLKAQAQKEPSQPIWRATLAFCELKAGRAETAWDILEQGSVDWAKSSPRCRLIQSLVLSANNSREASARVRKTLNLSVLKRQEQSLAETFSQGRDNVSVKN